MELDPAEHHRLLRRGIRLEWATTAWNVMEVAITVGMGIATRSLALLAFGLDSMIEVFASMVAIWHLTIGADPPVRRTRIALRLIAAAFSALAIFLVIASVRSLLLRTDPDDAPLGVAYLALTALVMFTLAAAKRRTAQLLRSEPLAAEASMTFLDGCLCVGILMALLANIVLGWWWADGLAALAVGGFAVREARGSLQEAASLS